MASDSDDATLGVQIANQFVNAANARLEQGLSPDIVAQAMRHAAANFSAFVASHGGEPEALTAAFADEFRETLAYYLPIHGEHRRPRTGLESVIDAVKKEQPDT
jgi:hypothetical protein